MHIPDADTRRLNRIRASSMIEFDFDRHRVILSQTATAFDHLAEIRSDQDSIRYLTATQTSSRLRLLPETTRKLFPVQSAEIAASRFDYLCLRQQRHRDRSRGADVSGRVDGPVLDAVLA